jgi:glycosyltransferase involved in cell wall biosynthesis
MPYVSVIIPTFNRANYLDAAIQSVLNQTFDDVDIIVVDDGSTDDTGDLIGSYGQRVRYVYQDHCGECGIVRNHGIQVATGTMIALLDSDDLWMPNKLELQLSYHAEHPEFGMIYSDAWYFDGETGQNIYRWQSMCHLEEGWIGSELLQNQFILMPTVLIKRSVLDDVGLFGETCDLELWLRVATRYRIGCVAEPLVRVRIHPGNNSRRADPLDTHRGGLALIEQATAFAPEVYAAAKPRAVFAQYYRTIGALVAQGRIPEARSLFAQAMQSDPQLTVQLFREAKALWNGGAG